MQAGAFEGKGRSWSKPQKGSKKASYEPCMLQIAAQRKRQSFLAPSDHDVFRFLNTVNLTIRHSFFFELGLLCLFLSSPLLSPLAVFSFLTF